MNNLRIAFVGGLASLGAACSSVPSAPAPIIDGLDRASHTENTGDGRIVQCGSYVRLFRARTVAFDLNRRAQGNLTFSPRRVELEDGRIVYRVLSNQALSANAVEAANFILQQEDACVVAPADMQPQH